MTIKSGATQSVITFDSSACTEELQIIATYTHMDYCFENLIMIQARAIPFFYASPPANIPLALPFICIYPGKG